MIPEYIIVHHSLTRDGEAVDWQSIRRYHTSRRYQGNIITEAKAKEMIAAGVRGVESPWRDIGYHFGVEKVGDRCEVLIGRMLDDTGAHCYQDGMNKKSWGIMVAGNFDDAPPAPEQFDLTVRLVRSLRTIGGVPWENVLRHCELASYKSCPGRAFPWDRFKSLI